MFDAMLNIMSVTTSVPTPEDLDGGADPAIVVTLTPGLMLPLADPNNPGRPLVIPGGNLRFRLDGPSAIDIGRKLMEGGEDLPQPSRIEIASSVPVAEDEARRIQELRG